MANKVTGACFPIVHVEGFSWAESAVFRVGGCCVTDDERRGGPDSREMIGRIRWEGREEEERRAEWDNVNLPSIIFCISSFEAWLDVVKQEREGRKYKVSSG